MNKLLIIFLMMNSMMFFSMKTPLSMGLILLIQTILMTLISGTLSFNFWYSYILLMIMIGGVLVLFLYISSLTSNLKFNKMLTNKTSTIKMFFFISTTLFTSWMILNSKIYLNLNNDLINLLNIEIEQNFILKMSMNKLYNKPTNWVMMMMINYLLFTLLIIVKIVNINLGPLRKFN